jgi:hypothetical protein
MKDIPNLKLTYYKFKIKIIKMVIRIIYKKVLPWQDLTCKKYIKMA